MAAEDVIHRIEEHVAVVDHASAHITKIADKADRAAGHLTKMGQAGHDAGKHIAAGAHHAHGVLDMLEHTISSLTGTAAVLGAAFGLHEALESTERYLKNIKEVHELTGATASETDFMLSSARRAGVPYENMARIMGVLSRRGAMLEGQMAAMTGLHIPSMMLQMRAMGVDITHGPIKAIEQMSTQVKKGKYGAAQLMSQFRIPMTQATNFETFLRELDRKKLGLARKGKGGFVSEDDFEGFKKLEEAQNRIADTWNRVKVTVLVKLMPVAAKLAERFADRLESMLPKLQAFGEFMADHMEMIVSSAKMLVTVLTARKFLGVLESLTSSSGFLGKLAAGGMAAGGGAITKLGGGIASLATRIGGIVSTFIRAVPQLALLAAAAWALYQGYKAIQDNVSGIGDRIQTLWDTISVRFELMGEHLNLIWERLESLFGASGTFSKFIGLVTASGLEDTLRKVDAILLFIQIGVGMLQDAVDGLVRSIERLKMPDLSFGGLSMAVASSFGKNLNLATKETAESLVRRKAEREAAEREKGLGTRPPNTVMNFPNAHFSINQQFAEGYDPDRVAVALSQAIASAGEMKVQSQGFHPLYALR